MMRDGFIALISVLILSAIGLLVGVGVSLRSVDDANITIASEHAARANAAATHCAEEALLKLRLSASYAGNETFANSGDPCSVLAVGGTGNRRRTVQATSTVMGATRKLNITVSKVKPAMKISSWQEVPDF